MPEIWPSDECFKRFASFPITNGMVFQLAGDVRYIANKECTRAVHDVLLDALREGDDTPLVVVQRAIEKLGARRLT